MPENIGGAGRDRTDGLLNAIQALFQLSYSPEVVLSSKSDFSCQAQTFSYHINIKRVGEVLPAINGICTYLANTAKGKKLFGFQRVFFIQ